MSIFEDMKDERMFELLRSQLALANEEKSGYLAQVSALTEEVHQLRLSQEQSSKEYLSEIKKLNARVGALTNAVLSKDKRIAKLESALANAEEMIKLGRSQRFGRTSEQRRLLNNRNIDKRAEEKSKFDGTKKKDPSDKDDENGGIHEASRDINSKIRKPSDTENSPLHVDKVIEHKLTDYYQLPEGARFMTRNGKIDIVSYKRIEYKPAQIIEHIYEVARVQLSDGSFIQSMDTSHDIKKCPFSASLLAQIVSWKYVYNIPLNRIRKRLRTMGTYISRETLNRYLHSGIQSLRKLLEGTLTEEVKASDYLMIDETCALVGLIKNGIKIFKKKYIWAFYAHLKKLVCYLYEGGSRSRDVVTKFLSTFSGYISSDGYVGYTVFDDSEKYPNIVHCGCWTHARRLFVEALPCDRQAMDVINDIAELFHLEIESTMRGDDYNSRKQMRQTKSNNCLVRLLCRVTSLSKDPITMSNALMHKAITYLFNQWESLRKFILDGRVQISNNLVEQRMKAIKLNMKVCQNIGSERAAENAAFIFSITESCSLNNIEVESYLEKVFRCLHLENVDKRSLLPCYINN